MSHAKKALCGALVAANLAGTANCFSISYSDDFRLIVAATGRVVEPQGALPRSVFGSFYAQYTQSDQINTAIHKLGARESAAIVGTLAALVVTVPGNMLGGAVGGAAKGLQQQGHGLVTAKEVARPSGRSVTGGTEPTFN